MAPALKSGVLYFFGAFWLGFLLGTARVLLIEPRLGSLAAVLLELPVMLIASWLFCDLLVRRFAVPSSAWARLAMGGVAFLLLQAAELALFLLIGEGGIPAFFATLGSAAGAAGLAGQAAFGLFPLVQAKRAREEG